jgi:hypothetical protein
MHNSNALLWILLFGAILLVMIGLSLVLIDTLRGKGRFGINTELPLCPRCGEKAPAIRVPTSINQFLWGGFTCKCGCEIDKWGHELRR